MTIIQVTFGDCDPAGIVFYPNIFRWLDRSFHDWLRSFGGHGQMCETLGAIGVGLIDARAQFKRPMVDGDHVSITLVATEWGRKTVTLDYRGTVGENVMFTAQEVRGLFKRGNDGIFATEIAALRELVEDIGKG